MPKPKNTPNKYPDYLPPRGYPPEEIVHYKIGGTIYEVLTKCGGTELLINKVYRLLENEIAERLADKK